MGNVDVLRVLTELGADLNRANHEGFTPAHIAAQTGSVDVLRVLRKLGADLYQANQQGFFSSRLSGGLASQKEGVVPQVPGL
jgi:ankyrin repeat protein